jgi:hypothetical protein
MTKMQEKLPPIYVQGSFWNKEFCWSTFYTPILERFDQRETRIHLLSFSNVLRQTLQVTACVILKNLDPSRPCMCSVGCLLWCAIVYGLGEGNKCF